MQLENCIWKVRLHSCAIVLLNFKLRLVCFSKFTLFILDFLSQQKFNAKASDVGGVFITIYMLWETTLFLQKKRFFLDKKICTTQWNVWKLTIFCQTSFSTTQSKIHDVNCYTDTFSNDKLVWDTFVAPNSSAFWRN